jgi:organic radical activating enzyme
MSVRFTPLETIERDVRSIANFVSTKEIRLSGGEPLLHPDIREIVRAIRNLNFAKRITLISNGVLIHKLNSDLLNSIDQLWISTYPHIKYKWKEAELRKRLKVYGVRLWVRKVSSFSDTFLNQRNKDTKSVKQIFRRCRIVHDWKCNFIYEGRLYKCTVAPFMEERLRPLGINLNNKASDSVSIIDNPNIRDDIEKYFSDKSPLKACDFCLGTVGKSVEHRQIGKNESELAFDTENVSKLISGRKNVISELMLFLGYFRNVHWFARKTKWHLRYYNKLFS